MNLECVKTSMDHACLFFVYKISVSSASGIGVVTEKTGKSPSPSAAAGGDGVVYSMVFIFIVAITNQLHLLSEYLQYCSCRNLKSEDI